MWWEERGYPLGERGDKRYGARLAMPWARESLANYMTEVAKDAVRREVLDQDCLLRDDTFLVWTLEDAWKAARASLGEDWGKTFYDRYLDFERVGHG